MEINYFQGEAQKIMKYDGKALQSQEPERDFSPTLGYVKLLILAVIGVFAIIYILVANFSKIGSEKSQQVSILKYNDLTYNVSDSVGGITSLFPLHMFSTLNKQEVVDRMECIVSENTTMCNKYKERQCQVYGLKDSKYDTCMLIQYEKAGMSLRSFCDNHYNISNGLWSKAEYTSNSFYVAKYECLKNAGIKRGVDYCKDQNFIDSSKTQKDLYECYADYKVSNQTYAFEKCNYEFPRLSTDKAVRINFMKCMKVMKIEKIEANVQCQYDYFWQFDSKYIKKCETILKGEAGLTVDPLEGDFEDEESAFNQEDTSLDEFGDEFGGRRRLNGLQRSLQEAWVCKAQTCEDDPNNQQCYDQGI